VEDLVRLLVTGLVVAAILVPVVRWFWSRFDRPTEAQVAYEEERARQKQEARMWAQIEAKMRADEAAAEKAAAEARYRLELEARAKGADRSQIRGAISALGSEELQPVLREVQESRPTPKATVGAEAAVQDGDAVFEKDPDDADLRVEGPVQVSLEQDRAGVPAPDWDLIERLRALKERTEDGVDVALIDPHPEVPAMPDLTALEQDVGAGSDESTDESEPSNEAEVETGVDNRSEVDPQTSSDEDVNVSIEDQSETAHDTPSDDDDEVSVKERRPTMKAAPVDVDTVWDEADTTASDDEWDVEW
jgi:hypothetical protein